MRLIDADELIDMLYEKFAGLCLLDEASEVVDACPTIDAKLVVRCKDCKYRGDLGNCYHPRHYGILPTAYPLDFCSYGERKDGGVNNV